MSNHELQKLLGQSFQALNKALAEIDRLRGSQEFEDFGGCVHCELRSLRDKLHRALTKDTEAPDRAINS
jgi:hypothetical protein